MPYFSLVLHSLMRRAAVAGAILAAAAGARAQMPTAIAEPVGGVRLHHASVYTTYYPSGSLLGQSSSGLTSSYNGAAGANLMLGWNSSGPRSEFSLTYSPAYSRDFTFSGQSILNHTFGFTFTRTLSPRWVFSTALAAEAMSTSESLFRSGALTQATDLAANPDQLASVVQGGTVTDNPALASLLTGSVVDDAPASRLYYGERVLRSALNMNLAWTLPRWTVTFTGGGSRMQNLPVDDPRADTAGLLPSSTSAHTGVSVAYSLSSRTSIGTSVGVRRVYSRYADTDAYTSVATLSRRMTRRWSLEVHGGTGVFRSRKSLNELPRGPQYVTGAKAGWRSRAHSLMFSVERGIADTYGYGSSSMLELTTAWSWRRPGSAWSVFSTFSQQQSRAARIDNVNAWDATAGFGRRLTRETAINFAYGHLYIQNPYGRLLDSASTNGLRVSIVWSPGGPRY